MELEHFSHEHPLILNEDQQHDGENFRSCNGCVELISGPFYSCSLCEFYLHKLCAELPRQMEHPMHPDHPLTLLANPSYPGSTCRCDVCHQGNWKNFTYHCSPCQFDIDIICASLMERKIEHTSHKHPLTPLPKPALSLCDACDTKHEGIFYLCTTCIQFGAQFWIHRDCASLPSTIKHSDHHHPLTLTYSLPHEYFKFRSYCDICGQELDKLQWLYYCAECRYFAHVNCATSRTEPLISPGRKTEIKVEDLDPNLIRLPVPDESTSVRSLSFKKMSLEENKKATNQQPNHFSHDHPLILFDVQSNDESSCSVSRHSLPNEMKNDKICDGCVRPISAPFYSCPQCNFFLHKWCAELPSEIHHPCHPQHPLILLKKSPQFFGLFRCGCCVRYCNRFTFSCASCDINLDVNCASVPSAVAHESHAHLLALTYSPPVKDSSDEYYEIGNTIRCNACDRYTRAPTFRCDTCDFRLDEECALLPRTVWHRYDTKHPLILTYSPPAKDYSDEYYCEICEKELNPKLWFYHCEDCDLSFHTRCLPCGRSTMDSNIKFGDTLMVDGHPHLLTLFRRTATGKSLCDYCHEELKHIKDFYFSLKCSQCNFMLHVDCASSCNKQSS